MTGWASEPGYLALLAAYKSNQLATPNLRPGEVLKPNILHTKIKTSEELIRAAILLLCLSWKDTMDAAWLKIEDGPANL